MNSPGLLGTTLCVRFLFLPFVVVKSEIDDKDDTENASDCFHDLVNKIRMSDLKPERIILIDTLKNNFYFAALNSYLISD